MTNSDHKSASDIIKAHDDKAVMTWLRLSKYLLLSWSISLVCGGAAALVVFVIFSGGPSKELSPWLIFSCIVSSLVEFSSGSFVLATLVAARLPAWRLVALYLIPALSYQISLFSGIAVDLKENPLHPIDYLNCALIVPCAIVGTTVGTNLATLRPHSILNVSFKHWLWITPLILFPTTFDLLFLAMMAFIPGESLRNNPQSVPLLSSRITRIIAFLLFSTLVWCLRLMTGLLVRPPKKKGLGVFAAVGTWLVLIVVQLIIFLLAGVIPTPR